MHDVPCGGTCGRKVDLTFSVDCSAGKVAGSNNKSLQKVQFLANGLVKET